MDATCAIQASIHVFSLVRKYVSRILGTYHTRHRGFFLRVLVKTRQVGYNKLKCFLQKTTVKESEL